MLDKGNNSDWSDLFEIATGTIIGSEHKRLGKNNQDASHTTVSPEALIAVVTDGCSASRHSEVGANIGARLVSNAVFAMAEFFENPTTDIRILDIVHKRILSDLASIAMKTGEDLIEIVNEYFLFTVLGVVLTKKSSFVFYIGDGVYFVNGQKYAIEPFPDNAPPYLGYQLLPDYPDYPFRVHQLPPLEMIDSVLIGTDGVLDFIDTETKNFPGQSQLIGPVSQFWLNDQYFQNPDMVRRTLFRANHESIKVDWESGRVRRELGRLPDDTTLITIRLRG